MGLTNFPPIKDGVIQVNSKEELGRYYKNLIHENGEPFICLNKLLWIDSGYYITIYQYLDGKVPYTNRVLRGYLIKPSRFKYLSFMKEVEEKTLEDKSLIEQGIIQEEYITEIECLKEKGFHVRKASDK